jgi:hypothetical protein
VLTWPLVTVFGFIAEPETHIFLKPKRHAHRGARVRIRFPLHAAAGLGD